MTVRAARVFIHLDETHQVYPLRFVGLSFQKIQRRRTKMKAFPPKGIKQLQSTGRRIGLRRRARGAASAELLQGGSIILRRRYRGAKGDTNEALNVDRLCRLCIYGNARIHCVSNADCSGTSGNRRSRQVCHSRQGWPRSRWLAGAEQALAAHWDGAEGEKSAGVAGAARLVFGSKGAAEQTRSWKTALLVRWAVSL